MAECSGVLVVQAPQHVFDAFSRDREEGLAELVGFSQADPEIIDECDVFFERLNTIGDSACFEFDGHYWLETTKRLAATGKNIGLYLHFWDEYGAQFFLAQNPEGKRFSFFAGGPEDDFEIEGGDVVTEENLQAWRAVIPEAVEKAFPLLVEVVSQT